MNLNNLKYFYDAVETTSITESAKRNFVTQSAVSQGIQKLENALKMPLITHQRNCFKLTLQGEQVFSLTQNLFRTIKAIEMVSKEHADEVCGPINIICTQSIAVNLISSVLLKFKNSYPKVTVKMKTGKLDNVFLMLKKGVMDVGIVVESPSCDDFEKHIIRKGYFQVYNKENLEIEGDGIYVDHINGLNVDTLKHNYKRKTKKDLIILQEMDSWQVLAKFAKNGIGSCFLPDFILEDNPLLVADKNYPGISYQIVAIHPKGVQLTSAAKKFIEALSNL